MLNTPELRFQVDESRKFAAIGEIADRIAASDAVADTTDGVRVTTDDGWWLLRASNTQDVLVARAGGPKAVSDFVAGLGIHGLRVDSDTAHLLYRAMGINPQSGTFQQNAGAARRADPMIQRRRTEA